MSAVPRRLSDRLLSDAPVRRTGRTRLVTGAIALAGLTVLGALGITFSGRPASSGPSAISVKDVATSTTSTSTTSGTTPTSTSATTSTLTTSTQTTSTQTTSTQTTTASSALDNLYSVLPAGFSATSCGPSDNPNPQALATVDCGQPDQGGGPTSARFSLFADANSLATRFQDGVNDDAVSQCPGSIDSPRSWHYDATPAFAAGSLVCGTNNNAPDLMWTKDDVFLLGDVQGPDLPSLYQWWLSLG
jgi:serine/threonine kinase PknH